MVITEHMKAMLADIAREYGIALFVLFGSQATGYTHGKSDVDIGFLAEKEMNYSKRYDLSLSLARAFKHPVVELVNLNAVSPELKKQAADQGVLLYEAHPAAFEHFIVHANRLYMETKPLRQYREEFLSHFLQKYA